MALKKVDTVDAAEVDWRAVLKAWRKDLFKIETRPAMPGHVGIRLTWRYCGIAHYANAEVDGRLIPMFKSTERFEVRPWEDVEESALASLRRVWKMEGKQ